MTTTTLKANPEISVLRNRLAATLSFFRGVTPGPDGAPAARFAWAQVIELRAALEAAERKHIDPAARRAAREAAEEQAAWDAVNDFKAYLATCPD